MVGKNVKCYAPWTAFRLVSIIYVSHTNSESCDDYQYSNLYLLGVGFSTNIVLSNCIINWRVNKVIIFRYKILIYSAGQLINIFLFLF